MDTVIVTGASRGLGRFCADQLTSQGYRVVGLGRNPDASAQFEMRSVDVSDSASVSKALHDLRRDTTV